MLLYDQQIHNKVLLYLHLNWLRCFMMRFADNNSKSSFVAGSARRRWAGRSDKSFAGAATQSAEFCSYDAVMQWFEPSDNLFPEMTQRKRSRLGPGTSTKRGGKAFEVIAHELLKNCNTKTPLHSWQKIVESILLTSYSNLIMWV